MLKDPLCVIQRQIIIKELQRRGKSYEPTLPLALAIWAKGDYNLQAKRGQVTSSRFHANKTKLAGISVHPRNTLRNISDAVSPRLQKVLLHRVLKMVCCVFEMNGDIICTQVKKYQAIAYERALRRSKKSVMFSKGWLTRFQKRDGLMFWREHGEGLCASTEASAHPFLKCWRNVKFTLLAMSLMRMSLASSTGSSEDGLCPILCSLRIKWPNLDRPLWLVTMLSEERKYQWW